MQVTKKISIYSFYFRPEKKEKNLNEFKNDDYINERELILFIQLFSFDLYL